MPEKRSHSPSLGSSERAFKKQATDDIVLQKDDDDLADILAQIKQHEESEALARKLQEEWNGESGSRATGSSSSRSNSSPVLAEEGPVDLKEDDEAFARRLAAQWAEEDGVAPDDGPGPSTLRVSNVDVRTHNTTSIPVTTRLTADSDAHEATPDEKLTQYRDVFVGSRNCTECGHELLSPRGYVRRLAAPVSGPSNY